jgi:GDPmannose 4,6-dehydratase
MWLSLQAERPDDYLFSSGTAHTLREFCAQAFSHAGLDYATHVRVDPKLVRQETGLIVGDCRKAQANLGWLPTVGFAELVNMMVDADLLGTSQSPPPRES